MGFIKKLFGGSESRKSSAVSGQGLFLFVQCDRCGDKVRLFIHREHELNRTEGGYIWHKTIIDSKCFQPITTVVNFDNSYNISQSEIDGGHYISQEEFESPDVS
jgi:hypothetical protein